MVGLPAIGLLNVESIKQYEKVYLKQFFVRGFSYYDGPTIIDEINKSGQLELVREPKNKFDKRAIALHFNKQKIGYLPRESNKTISILMDTELLEFHAEITHIAHEASDWEKIRVAVYALKEIKHSNDLKKIEPFSELYTPTYYSINSEDNTLTRIALIENRDTDDIIDAPETIIPDDDWTPENVEFNEIDETSSDVDDEKEQQDEAKQDEEQQDDFETDIETNEKSFPLDRTIEPEIQYVRPEQASQEDPLNVEAEVRKFLKKMWEEV